MIMMNRFNYRLRLALALVSGLLLFSLDGYAQRKSSGKQASRPPMISKPDKKLAGTRWRMMIDTSGEGVLLTFHRLQKGAAAPFLVEFIDAATFLMTVHTSNCSFKTKGTYSFALPAPDGSPVPFEPGNFIFNRYDNEPPCTTRFKERVAHSYFTRNYTHDSFQLKEELAPNITAPAK